MILTAADEDDNALELDHKLARLHEISNRVTIYFNSHDRALATSDITKGNPDRLGTNGPRNPRATHRNYVSVDCSQQADDTFSANHSYHVESKRVSKDISMGLGGAASPRDYDAHSNGFSLK